MHPQHLFAAAFAVCALVAGSAHASPALLRSAEQGDLAGVQHQLRSGAAVDTRDARQRTPLLLATWANHPAVAQALIAAGADVNAKDDQQDSPYLVAGAHGRTEILKMTLAHGADLRSTNRYGGTALIPASEKGHPEAVRLLIQAGADVDFVNNLGWTSLLEVVILGQDTAMYQNITRQLIAAKANLNLPDRDGVTPLQHAKKRGLTQIAALLAQAGAQ